MKEMYEFESNDIEINLREIFIALKRNLLKIILVVALCAGAVSGYTTFFVEPIYSSTAELYILANEDGQQIYSLSVGDQLAQDYIRLATTKNVLQTAIDDLDLDMDYRTLQGQVNVENPTDTRFMMITVIDHDPKQAQELAQKIAEVTAETVSETMQVPQPTIVDEAEEPTYPDGPNVRRNAIIGGLIGCVLSVFVIVIRVILNDTIQSEDDIERYLGINMLAKLPEEQKRRDRKGTRRGDEFKNLYVNKNRGIRGIKLQRKARR